MNSFTSAVMVSMPSVSGLIEGLTSIDPETVVEGLQGIIDKISGGLQWIKDNKDTVVTAVEAIIAAWAGLKVAEGIGTVLKVINGIKSLTGGSAASAGATAGASWAGAFATAAMKAAPFLAFLYTLLNPSGSATNDLDLVFDENGNPTQAARDAGITQTREEFEAEAAYNPEWQRQAELQTVQDKYNTQYTGLIEDAEDRTALRRNHGRALEEAGMTSTAISGAVRSALAGMGVYMNGEKVGEMVSPYVDVIMAGQIEE